MGDHRCSIKIEWSMHGHTESADMWLNYYPSDDCYDYRVDRRVLEWLTDQYERSMSRWHDMEEEAAEQRRREREAKMSETEKRIEALRKEADALEENMRADPGRPVPPHGSGPDNQ
jgi:SMC interacting uncharacterized protein involved in chromosome segregation